MTEITAIDGACAQCGAPFKPARASNIYCSKLCAGRAHEERRTLKREGNVTPPGVSNVTACLRCQEPVESTGGRPRLYCSAACKMAASRSRKAFKAVDWIPEPGDNHGEAPQQRRKLIRQWADQGYSSRQMAEKLDMWVSSVKTIARELQVTVTADQVIGKSRQHDSARIVRETTQTLEGLLIGISLVIPDDLDPAEAKAWATSITSSARTLTQFASQIREMTR